MDRNPIQLANFAKEASDLFVKKGIPLNDAIAKIAEEHELSPMQIRRVAESANHDVQGQLFKGAKDKSFTFDLADADAILQKVRSGGEHVKVAQEDVLSAALSRPRCREEIVKVAAEAIAADPDEKMKLLKDIQFNLEKLSGHLKHFRAEVRIRHGDALAGVEESIGRLQKMAQDHILTNGGKLSDFLKFACIQSPEFSDGFKRIFGHIKEELMKVGAPVDRSLISDNLEIPSGTLEIINGSHTLAVELDTLKRKISEEDRAARHMRLMDTFGDAVVNSMKIIKTPEDADRSILEDTWMLSKAAEEEGIEPFLEVIDKEAGVLLPITALGLGAGYGGYHFLKEMSKGVAKKTHLAADPYYEMRRVRQLT